MQLTLTFPVLFTARELRTNKMRDVFIASRKNYEIPEYSMQEAELAYRIHGVSEETKIGGDDEDIILLNGKLYRLLDEANSAAEYWFDHPFHNPANMAFADQGLGAHFEWKIQLQKILGVRSKKIWPEPEPDECLYDFTFEQNLNELTDINKLEVQESFDSISKVSESLVMIDGDLWGETAPPRRFVVLAEFETAPYYFISEIVGLRDSFPNPHFKPTGRNFNIGDEQSALRYIEELKAFPRLSKKTVGRQKYQGHRALIEEEPFDGATEQIAQISRGLAYASVVTAHRKPVLSEKLDWNELALLDTAKTTLLNENHLLGRNFDMSDNVRDLLKIWRTLGRPKSEECLGWKKSERSDEFIEHTLDNWEPISFPAQKNDAGFRIVK